MLSWAALGKVLSAGWGRSFFPSTQHWWGHTWSTVSSPGLLNTRETWASWRDSNEGPSRWFRVWSIWYTKKGWQGCDCLTWKTEGSVRISSMHINTCKEGAKRMEPDFSVIPSDRTRGNGQWNTGDSVWISGNTLFLSGWLSTGIGCSGKLWIPPPWKYRKASWMWSCTTSSKWPCMNRGAGPDDLQRCLPTSTTLCFCESIKSTLFPVDSSEDISYFHLCDFSVQLLVPCLG